MDAADNQVEIFDRTGVTVASLAGGKEEVARGILRMIEDRFMASSALSK